MPLLDFWLDLVPATRGKSTLVAAAAKMSGELDVPGVEMGNVRICRNILHWKRSLTCIVYTVMFLMERGDLFVCIGGCLLSLCLWAGCTAIWGSFVSWN